MSANRATPQPATRWQQRGTALLRPNRQSMLLVLLVLLLVTTLAWNHSLPGSITALSTPTPTPYIFAGTPIPAQLVDTGQETNGIVLGGIIMVLIVVGGTFAVIRQKEE